MILGLRTDTPVATIALLADDGSQIATYTWEAHRNLARDLLVKVRDQLEQYGADWVSVRGVIIYEGPGSFTGLRIGAAVANTIAHAQEVPIVGASGERWRQDGAARLMAGDNDQVVLPKYGSEAHITKPKK